MDELLDVGEVEIMTLADYMKSTGDTLTYLPEKYELLEFE
jgi:hypothetical protein